MVARALSEAEKRRRARQALDKRLDNAAEVYKLEQSTSEKPRGLQAIASEFDVSMKSLARHVNGDWTQEEYMASQQWLSRAKEQVLVDFIIESADHGFPMNQDQIAQHANTIVQKEGEPPLGEHWINGFHDHHKDVLQTIWSKPLDMQCACALNIDVKQAWFDLVKKYIIDNYIPLENIYGMDESGFTPSHSNKEHVYCSWGTKTQHKQGGTNHENVTVLVTICVDGSALQPMIIYKGWNFMKK